MNGLFYRLTRDLHLYLGLFISPFVLVFSVSVFFFVHSWVPKFAPDAVKKRVVSTVALPSDIEKLSGRPQIEALKPTLANLGVPGEVGFIQHNVVEKKWIIPVVIPGRTTTVTIDLASHEASIVVRETGWADALMTLHISPGQHGPTIRMNWFYMKLWRWFADATVYLTIFISVSGIYLWYMLRAERRVGFILLFAGVLTFFQMAYALSY